MFLINYFDLYNTLEKYENKEVKKTSGIKKVKPLIISKKKTEQVRSLNNQNKYLLIAFIQKQ